MSMTDPIADMLTRIRNGCMARLDRVDMPNSNLKLNMAKLMKKHGYISNYRVVKDDRQGMLRIFLKYQDDRPVILGLKRISKPGRRHYAGKDEITKVRGGYGMAIVSTSKGVMTDVQAREQGIGGEVVCAIW